jgi:hypothetical protein
LEFGSVDDTTRPQGSVVGGLLVSVYSRSGWSRVAGAAVILLVLAPVVSCARRAASTPRDETPWSPPALGGNDAQLPEARDVVRGAVEFLRSHPRLAFEALASYEVAQKNGQKIHFDMLHRVAVQRPERIFWVTLYDDASKDSAWFSNGRFTFLREPANVWARVEVGPTVSEALSVISTDYNIVVPFVDVLSGDVEKLWLGEGVESVDYIGEAWTDGYWTHHVAMRKPGVDAEIWFRQGDAPFPVRMTIVRTDDAHQPEFSARFRRWSTHLPDDAIPQFEPPEGSEQVEVFPANGH